MRTGVRPSDGPTDVDEDATAGRKNRCWFHSCMTFPYYRYALHTRSHPVLSQMVCLFRGGKNFFRSSSSGRSTSPWALQSASPPSASLTLTGLSICSSFLLLPMNPTILGSVGVSFDSCDCRVALVNECSLLTEERQGTWVDQSLNAP